MLHVAPSPVPQVDPITDGFDWWNAVVGTAGILIAIAAIIIAIRADKRADKILTEERRRVFELEILRELVRDLDTGALREVILKPLLLRDYRLRLNQLSSRLPFWDRLMTADDVLGVMAVVGLGEYSDVDRRITEANAGQQAISTFIVNIPYLHQQPHATQENLLTTIKTWLPDYPPIAPGQNAAWAEAAERLTQQREAFARDLPELRRRRRELHGMSEIEVPRCLAADLDSAIKDRMSPTPLVRPWWWFVWPPWWIRV